MVSAARTPDGSTQLSVFRDKAERPGSKFAVGGQVTGLSLSNDGRYVAVAGDTLRVVDLDSEAEVAVRRTENRAAATSVAFHPSQPLLLVGRSDTGVEQWRISKAGVELIERKTQWHQTVVSAVGYSPDGAQRFSADTSGRIVLWRELQGDSIDAREVYSHAAVASGSPSITTAAMTNKADGQLAYGCDDGSVYEIAGWWPSSDTTGRVRSRTNRRPPPAKRLASGFLNVRPKRFAAGHPQGATSIAYAEEGDLVLSAGGDTLLVQRSSSADASLPSYKSERRYHDKTVLSVAVGPDETAYSSDKRGRVTRWRLDVAPESFTLDSIVETREEVVAIDLEARDDATGSLTFADSNGFLHRWADIARPQGVELLYSGHADNRDMQAWHVAGESPKVVTVAADNRACVWREADGLLELTFDLGGRTVVTVDAERRMLYAASDGRAITGAAAMAFPLDGGTPLPLWANEARVSAMLPLESSDSDDRRFLVGQRDGQVYLWGSSTGRSDLIASASRPHWRPVRALAYDSRSGRFFSGDSDGLLVEWPVDGAGKPTTVQLPKPSRGTAPVVRLAVGPTSELLAVQRTPLGSVSACYFKAPSITSGGEFLRSKDLRDVAIDPATGRVVALRRFKGGVGFATWSPRSGWSSSGPTAAEELQRLSATPDGWLGWGRGTVHWMASDDRGQWATRIVSRPTPAVILGNRADQSLKAVTSIGSIDQWNLTDESSRQERFANGKTVLASCHTPDNSEVFIAVAAGQGSTRLERWSLVKNRRVAKLSTELSGECRAIATADDRLVAAFDDRLVTLPADGGDVAETPFDFGSGQPVTVSLSEDGEQAAVSTDGGFAVVGRRAGGNTWRLARLDREGVTTAAFTADGSRLLVGVESGRVQLLELMPTNGDQQPARTLLTFTGHSDRVTLLQVNRRGTETRIVSGDASGRVMVRAL
ncbi:MAG: WD40 repeat domain-containing protein [Planctomycetota bacterium]